MSRAFTKERDDAPEPVAPRADGPRYLTPEGMERLRQRVVALEAELDATATDDSAYDPIRVELAQTRAELAAATPVPPARRDRVSLGTVVHLRLADGSERVVELVGDDEVDPASGRIGARSPLAVAIEGLGVGDRAVWHRPAGDTPVTVESIDVRAA